MVKQEEQWKCATCQTIYIIKHFLIKYETFAFTKKLFYANNMKDLFKNINTDDILSFLKEMKLHLRL